MKEEIRKLKDLVDKASHIVFFGGAGVSTESGIPDFRSTGGLYHQEWKYPPEVILSHSFYKSNPEEFFRFYRAKMLAPDAKPSPAHYKLAEWEKQGKLLAVVTQNIDGLHQAAGSREVLELHGSVHRNRCMHCGKSFDAAYVKAGEGLPLCDACGGLIKPDVTLYEEVPDQDTMARAVGYIRRSDLLIVGGTSLVVYPAAGLLRYYSGSRLVLINLGETPYDSSADLVIHGRIGEVFSQIKA